VLPIPTPPRIPAALPFDFDDQVGPEAGIEQEVGVLQSIFAEDGPFGLVDGHARNPQRADKPLEGRLVMVGSLGHRRRDRGITLGSGTGIGAASGRPLVPSSDFRPGGQGAGADGVPIIVTTGSLGPGPARRRRGGRIASAYSQ